MLALKFQQLTRKCIVMQNLSHNNLIQKVTEIRNASTSFKSRGKKLKRKERDKGIFVKRFLDKICEFNPFASKERVKASGSFLSSKFMILFCALKKIVAICLSNEVSICSILV